MCICNFVLHGQLLRTRNESFEEVSDVSCQLELLPQEPSEDLSGLEGLPLIRNIKGQPPLRNQTEAVSKLLGYLRRYTDRDAAVWLIDSNLWIFKEGKQPKYSYLVQGYRIFNDRIHHIDRQLYERSSEPIDFDQGLARIFVVNQDSSFKEVFTFLQEPVVPKSPKDSRIVRIKTQTKSKVDSIDIERFS